MKKVRSLIFALLFSGAAVLALEAINITTHAALGCGDLMGCCNDESCAGRGTATGCSIVCEDGTTIGCPAQKNGTCAGLLD